MQEGKGIRLAVIPARGGSKRIPRKNIRNFLGKPIIAYSIEAAKQSGCFDEIMVSTDDAEIANVAKECGATVPFTRPAELSNDYCGTVEVIGHAVDWYEQQGQAIDAVCCIYATAPFVQAGDLAKAHQMLQNSSANYAFPVTTFAFPVQRAVSVDAAGKVSMFDKQFQHTRSQDLEEAYHDCGQFYWGRPQAFKAAEPIFTSDALALPIPRYRVQDIDTEEDWQRAELLYTALRQNQDI